VSEGLSYEERKGSGELTGWERKTGSCEIQYRMHEFVFEVWNNWKVIFVFLNRWYLSTEL